MQGFDVEGKQQLLSSNGLPLMGHQDSRQRLVLLKTSGIIWLSCCFQGCTELTVSQWRC